jgi:hypothetical protein
MIQMAKCGWASGRVAGAVYNNQEIEKGKCGWPGRLSRFAYLASHQPLLSTRWQSSIRPRYSPLQRQKQMLQTQQVWL